MIRTTWDYTFRRDEFLAFVDDLPMPVANPAGRRPVELAQGLPGRTRRSRGAGGAVVTGPRGEPAVRYRPSARTRIIVKPAISAGARGVGLFAVGRPGGRRTPGATLLTAGDASSSHSSRRSTPANDR